MLLYKDPDPSELYTIEHSVNDHLLVKELFYKSDNVLHCRKEIELNDKGKAIGALHRYPNRSYDVLYDPYESMIFKDKESIVDPNREMVFNF